MKINFKKAVLILSILIGLGNYSFSQDIHNQEDNNLKSNDTSYVIRNVIGFVPSNANVINGWAIGYLDLSSHKAVKINGIYTNIGPLQLISSVFMIPRYIGLIFGGDMPRFHTDNNNIYGNFVDKDTIISNQVVNGLAFSILDISDYAKINGLNFSVISNFTNKTNGIAIAGIMNLNIKFNGLMIGTVNFAEKGNGVQIGLINNCGDLNGVQIGLINKSRKRVLPIINF